MQEMQVEADFITHIQRAVRIDWPVHSATGIGFTAPSYNAFGGTVTPSGSVRVNTGTRFVIKIISGGAVGVATFQTSQNGGLTFGATQTTSASMTDATTGITLAFSGTLTTAGTASFMSALTPMAQWNDAGGNSRLIVDHLGFPGGRFNAFDEEWQQLADARIASSPSYALGTLTSGYPSPFGTVAGSTGTNTNYYAAGAAAQIHGGATFLVAVFEAEVSYSSITATNTTLGIGLSDSLSVAAPSNAILFQRASGGTNWQALITGIAPVTLGVPPVVGSVPSQTFKMEIFGSASSDGGGTGRVRFCVDGNPVGDISGTIPSAAMFPIFGVTTGGSAPSVGTNQAIGPFRLSWARWQTPNLL